MNEDALLGKAIKMAFDKGMTIKLLNGVYHENDYIDLISNTKELLKWYRQQQEAK